MSADSFVRPARAADAADLARIQIASWQARYADLVPRPVLAELTSAEAARRWHGQWEAAVTRPPTSRHRVLVAIERGDNREVVGFTSFGPATDQELWPATDAELYELHVQPELTRRGHGSRLLNALADTVRDDGFHTLCAWALESNTYLREFLESAGWAPDGARRALDMGTPVPEIRLHAAVGLQRPPARG
ncbi:MAG TPA: GNAT family N-acetyltransferase [Streptosporangiaceae bacterium]|nr:GNAT family N-acetyltransferase [Streptosporangiaceae bacterium]